MKTYWIHPKISWRAFKSLNEKLAPSEGVTPENIDKILWQLLRDRKLNIYFTDRPVEGETCFLTEKPIPKNATMIKSK